MRNKTLVLNYVEYDSLADMPAAEAELMRHAVDATATAYAPYSNFQVGACVRLEDGTLVCGNNQENASYPQGLCAERVALFSTSARYPDKRIETMALIAPASPDVLSPCGACRQVLLEYEKRQGSPIRILMGSQKGKVIAVHCAGDLLPFCFSKENLSSVEQQSK